MSDDPGDLGDFCNSLELTPLESGAVALFEMFKTYLRAGFARDDALSLIAKIIVYGQQNLPGVGG